MTRAKVRRGTALLAVPAALVAAGGAPAAGAGDGMRVIVTVTDLRSSKGQVLACLTPEPQSFPKCRNAARAHAVAVRAAPGGVTVTFDHVTPGRYAVALLHDENANGKADRALGMMPREGFGFSRDAPVKMGPPTFDDAVFELGGRDKQMTIRMRYML